MGRCPPVTPCNPVSWFQDTLESCSPLPSPPVLLQNLAGFAIQPPTNRLHPLQSSWGSEDPTCSVFMSDRKVTCPPSPHSSPSHASTSLLDSFLDETFYGQQGLVGFKLPNSSRVQASSASRAAAAAAPPPPPPRAVSLSGYSDFLALHTACYQPLGKSFWFQGRATSERLTLHKSFCLDASGGL